MPIEFQCTACSRTLRVPGGTAGKYSRCPGCSERLQIPSPIQLIHPKALPARIGVPCPKCKSTLECDSSLDGTRGCCPTCAHVFTIRMNSDLQEVLEDDSVFPFACPRCKQLFEGTSDKEGRKGKCTNCSEVFVIERYIPPKPIVDIKPATSIPALPTRPKAKPSKNLRAAEPKSRPAATKPVASGNNDGFANLGDFLPPTSPSYSAPSDGWIQPNASMPTYSPPPSPAKRRKGKNQGSGSGVKMILSILGAVAGVFLLLCCGGGGALFYYATSAKTISMGGYSVDAPGMHFEPKMRDATVSGKAISNPRTRSEFMIATTGSSNSQNATVENYVAYLKSASMTFDRDVSPIERAGLRGFRVKMRPTPGIPSSLMEIFDLKGQILMMVYVNGAEGSKLKGLRTTLSESQAEAIDNPEQFFQSLHVSP